MNPKTKKSEVKTTSCCNREKRDSFIERYGMEEFNKVCTVDESWEKLKDIPVPTCFMWLFDHFLTIWYNCEIDLNGNRILRPVDIKDYCECFGINMTYRERSLILSMKSWAGQTIVQLEEQKGD